MKKETERLGWKVKLEPYCEGLERIPGGSNSILKALGVTCNLPTGSLTYPVCCVDGSDVEGRLTQTGFGVREVS